MQVLCQLNSQVLSIRKVLRTVRIATVVARQLYQIKQFSFSIFWNKIPFESPSC